MLTLHNAAGPSPQHVRVDLDGTVLAFEADPDVLREKVEGFIKTIDTYLAKENQ